MGRTLTYAEAIREALEQEMERDDSVVVFGIGVDDHKAIFGTTKGLVEKFGSGRVFDTPLSEDCMTGAAIGMSLAGLRPVHIHIRMDFLLLAMNQLVNVAAKSRYMFGGKVSIPIVVRAIIGRSWGQGAQHSQGLHALFAHIPGIKVVAPSTPCDAKGCLIQSIRDDNPVIMVEHRMLHPLKGEVEEEPYSTPYGRARVLAPGEDITIVGVSHMVVECLRARHYLKQQGVTAEVIDPVSVSPLDIETIWQSLSKTKRLLVVDTAWTNCGLSAEIFARVLERNKGPAGFKVARMGFEPVPCPTTKNLENLFYPNARRVAYQAYQMLHEKPIKWKLAVEDAPEVVDFRGPF